jgi:hypothetical protein
VDTEARSYASDPMEKRRSVGLGCETLPSSSNARDARDVLDCADMPPEWGDAVLGGVKLSISAWRSVKGSDPVDEVVSSLTVCCVPKETG